MSVEMYSKPLVGQLQPNGLGVVSSMVKPIGSLGQVHTIYKKRYYVRKNIRKID